MLVLSRKAGQRIDIGDGITLVVSRIQGNRVVIGIEAPQQVNVRRGELKPWGTGSQQTANSPADALG